MVRSGQSGFVGGRGGRDVRAGLPGRSSGRALGGETPSLRARRWGGATHCRLTPPPTVRCIRTFLGCQGTGARPRAGGPVQPRGCRGASPPSRLQAAVDLLRRLRRVNPVGGDRCLLTSLPTAEVPNGGVPVRPVPDAVVATGLVEGPPRRDIMASHGVVDVRAGVAPVRVPVRVPGDQVLRNPDRVGSACQPVSSQ